MQAGGGPAGSRTSLIIAQVTIETTGAMLLGSEIAAALTALEPLGIDMIGLNCATGPGEMSEHLRYLAAHARIPISCEPNAGPARAHPRRRQLPADPGAAGGRARPVHQGVRPVPGRRLLRHHPRAHRRARRPGGAAAPAAARRPRPEPGRRLAVRARAVPPGHRVPGHRRADQRQRVQGVPRRDARKAGTRTASEIARAQTRDGAHLLDVCVDYVGRDGVADMREVAGRLATAATLPLVLDSTEPAVIEAGLELTGGRVGHQLGQLRGRRRARLPDRAGHAAGARARRRGHRADHRRAGPGPHRASGRSPSPSG